MARASASVYRLEKTGLNTVSGSVIARMTPRFVVCQC